MMSERQTARYWVYFSPCLLLLLLVIIGCWGDTNADLASTSSQGEPEQTLPGHVKVTQTQAENPETFVAGWDKPRIAFVLTGDQKGYMEPCGCSETQSGGISRRADLFRQLREEKGWDVIGLDAGNFVKRSRRQDQIKFGVMHTALSEMGYRAMTLGPADLKLTVDHLFSTVSNSVDPNTEFPLVSSNVIFYDTPDLGSPARQRVIEINDLKIGVTGVIGESHKKKAIVGGNESAGSLLRVEDPIASTKAAVEELKAAECDLLILLSQSSVEETEEILQAIPDFDICLTSGGPEDPTGRPKSVGETVVIEPGRKGKYAGVLGYYPQKEQKFHFELVDLDKNRFQRTEAMEAHMANYQEQLNQENIVENEPAVPHPSSFTFVGAEKCGTCHTKAYAKWKDSKHAHATETLITGEEGYHETEWISRINDPECLSCHSTGWHPQEVYRYEGGFVGMEQTPHLAGQGCENCHGPGSHHTDLELEFLKTKESTPEVVSARDEMKVDLVTAEQKVCRKCHDFENSPKFDFQKYWDKVIHRGKD